ncbi:hypothetical protein JWJ90_16190 [Desulfobulbus rhabdoformis]|uniref:hypothetical protein n=1 Tax=Desulfobulbus rhabdoformis TaxID=34032 RepID=UPI0019642B1B|nr:hypothetical protein [Desulfobulbus rhabdoformis]MBM9615809.1 hypothetical protein [Desulfobulbus rhabdoformis]
MIASCLCGALVSGCVNSGRYVDPYQARADREAAMEQRSVKSSGGDVLLATLTSINMRIHAYREKLKSWQELERESAPGGLSTLQQNQVNQCQAQLQDILLEYTALQQQLKEETRRETAKSLAGNSLLRLNQQDIDYLEGDCSKLLAKLQQSPPAAATGSVDPQIQAAYTGEDYDRVITLYNQMTRTPGVTPSSTTSLQYGQALVKNHQPADALRVLGPLLEAVRQQPGQEALLLPLMQLVADLDFTRGAYDDARRKYEEVIRLSIEKGAHQDEWAALQLAALQPGVVQAGELGDFAQVLKNYLSYVPRRDGFSVNEAVNTFRQQHPYTTMAPNVGYLNKSARDQANAWLNKSLKSQDVAPQSPAVAGTSTSQNMPQQQTPATAQTDAGTGGQATSPSTPLSADQALQAEFDKGVALLDAKEYDQAIAQLQQLQGTSLAPQAEAKIAEASKRAGQALRQKAAELFVRANSSRDTDEKRKMLLGSRDLLQSILSKYPHSGLEEKVQRNLARINADLSAIEPY